MTMVDARAWEVDNSRALVLLMFLQDCRENYFNVSVLLIMTSPKLYSPFQKLTMPLK